jgi:hypothetical protein
LLLGYCGWKLPMDIQVVEQTKMRTVIYVMFFDVRCSGGVRFNANPAVNQTVLREHTKSVCSVL